MAFWAIPNYSQSNLFHLFNRKAYWALSWCGHVFRRHEQPGKRELPSHEKGCIFCLRSHKVWFDQKKGIVPYAKSAKK